MSILANVVWPSLYLASRMWVWWIVAAGLVIEFGFVLWLTKTTPVRAASMTLLMNIVSAALGIIGIPASGIIWELIAEPTLYRIFDLGTFNPVTWVVSCVLAALLNCAIELGFLRLAFKIPWTRRNLLWLTLANLITASAALVTIWLNPPEF